MEEPVWIDVLDPDPASLAEALARDVHPTAAAWMLAAPPRDDEPRPRLESHGDYLFGVLIVPVWLSDGEGVRFQEISFVAGQSRFITVNRTLPADGSLVIDRLRSGARALHATPALCLSGLFDAVAEHWLTVVSACRRKIEDLQDETEKWRANRVQERLSRLGHDLLRLQQILTPTRDAACSVLANGVSLEGDGDFFSRPVKIDFADAHHKLLRAADHLALCQDLLVAACDDHRARVLNDQHEVMKRLTVTVSLLLLPIAIVDLYHSNVRSIAEHHSGDGWLWGLILITTIAQLVNFRRKRWF